MLFSEFMEGTQCRDNEYNHKVFRDLEVMYMNSNMTKADVYEYGKKLVDNSKTEAELKFEAEIKEQIHRYKVLISQEKQEREYRRDIDDKYMIKYCTKNIQQYRAKIKELRWVLGLV